MKDKVVLIHSESRANWLISVAVSQSELNDRTRLHILVCVFNQDLLDELQDELNRGSGPGVIGSLVPVYFSETASFLAPRVQQGFEHWISEWAINAAINIDAIVSAAIAIADAAPHGDKAAEIEITSIPVREVLSSGILAALGCATYNGRLPKAPALRWPLVHIMESFFKLVQVENNIKVYKDAFGFGRPKAHKDVRTYREAIRRMEQGRHG